MNPVRSIVVCGLRLYRWVVSPVLAALAGPGLGCRFHPTCSAYALEAVQRFGVCRGGWLAAKRLMRCHPWGGFGEDPVPERFSLRNRTRGPCGMDTRQAANRLNKHGSPGLQVESA
ncbi:membrane protein insertion efficiency factor YidD [Limisphaera sp. VF-2]|uniref:membrane protein insertion efficiency factor YidD n=1 Tax=Limisphaera sp. VF-2 TaxID=3400418 RepID=UPI003C2A5C4B